MGTRGGTGRWLPGCAATEKRCGGDDDGASEEPSARRGGVGGGGGAESSHGHADMMRPTVLLEKSQNVNVLLSDT